MARIDLEVTFCYRASVPPVKKKALCIGIGYRNLDKIWHLPKAREDPIVFRDFLFELYGFNEEDIIVLTDDDNVDWYPTRENILLQIGALVKDSNPGDHLVFFFSGHGSQVPNEDGTEEDGLDEVIWPSDIKLGKVSDDTDQLDVQNYIIDDDLKRHLVDNLPNGVQLTVLLDCCHSGTGLDLPHSHSYSISDDGTVIPRTESPAQLSLPDDPPESDSSSKRVASAERPKPKPLQRRVERAPTRRQSKLTLNMPYLALGRHSTDSNETSRRGTIELKSRNNSVTFCSVSKHVTSWSACLDNQIGIECPDGGLLTHAFMSSIRENPNATNGELLNALTIKFSKTGVVAKKELRERYQASMECPVPSLGSLAPVDEILHKKFTF